MSDFVLVHGAWHGGWAWEKIVPLLQEAGHKVETPDLPGAGGDETPPGEVTLAGYAERVVGVLDSLEGPAILVGHSMGGAAISEATERRPEKVEALVYVCAFLLPDGVSLFEVAQQDTEALTMQNSEVDGERGVVTLPAAASREIFYGETSQEDADWALARLREQPLAPFGTPVHVTEGNFGRVPRVYVTCLRDKSITPQAQKEMYTQTPCREVVSMQTDHSPFLSRPEELARHLLSVASTTS